MKNQINYFNHYSNLHRKKVKIYFSKKQRNVKIENKIKIQIIIEMQFIMPHKFRLANNLKIN